MKLLQSHALAALLVVLAGGLATVPAHAAQDFKAVNAASCLPYGPDTVVSELTYNQQGITNPGTTTEKVICTVPNDAESAYSSTPGTSANAYVFYRAGGIQGKVACSVYVSNAAIVAGAVYSTSSNPPYSAAGVRAYLSLPLADTSGGWSIGAATVIVCTIYPKTTMGGYTFVENLATDTP